jgi:hypothetical protein
MIFSGIVQSSSNNKFKCFVIYLSLWGRASLSTEHMAQVQIFDDDIYVTLLFCNLSRNNGQTLVIRNRIEKCNYDEEAKKNILRQSTLKNEVLKRKTERRKFQWLYESY